jgi:hypothetical protein
MTEHDLVDTALRQYHRAGPQPAPEDLAAIRRRVLTSTAGPRVRPVRRIAVAVAATAAVAAGVITLWPNGTTGTNSTTDYTATTRTNDRAAIDAITKADSAPATVNLVVERVANAQPLDVRHGGYLHTAERSMSVQSVDGPDGPAYYVAEDVIERWSALDEGTLPELMRMTRGLNAHPLTAADGEKLARYGTDYTKVSTSTFDPATSPKRTSGPAPEPGLDNPTPAYLASLPTDPGQLLAMLRTTVGNDREVFKEGAALSTMADALLSPELRAALYQALAMVPGVERIPGTVDLAGRPGVAIAHSARGMRTELVIDPASSRMLGFRMVQLTDADGVPAGTVIYSATADQKIVDRVGAK